MVPMTPEQAALLERDLRSIFAARLQSLVAYGHRTADGSSNGHAHAAGHRAQPAAHALAIVDSLTGSDLRACAESAARWHDAGLATPLLLAAGELERSLDAFPLELGAIIADHTIVCGRNPFEGVSVDPADLRRACEVQARSHLLHLREGFVETHGHGDAVAVLIVRSAAPLAALLQTVSRLDGAEPRDAAAAARRLERALDLPPGALAGIVQLVPVKEIPAADAVRMFPSYLDAVERLVRYVDTWSRP